MSRRPSNQITSGAQNPGQELSNLTRSARFPGGKPSVRSRSVPTSGRDGGRNDSVEITTGRSLRSFPYDQAVPESVPESECDDTGEHTNEEPLAIDVPSIGQDQIFGTLQNRQESDYTLSEERWRRRIDSDRVSETDTIVPRRNLSVIDVAALIFNKMVIPLVLSLS
jgi:hypothetical protein